MTTRVYSVHDIMLQEWEKPVRIFPLTIKKFRKVAEILDILSNPKTDADKEKTFVDVLLEATASAMETFEPELSTVEVLEEHVDMQTLKYIINVATGVTFDDPNLQAVTAAGQN